MLPWKATCSSRCIPLLSSSQLSPLEASKNNLQSSSVGTHSPSVRLNRSGMCERVCIWGAAVGLRRQGNRVRGNPHAVRESIRGRRRHPARRGSWGLRLSPLSFLLKKPIVFAMNIHSPRPHKGQPGPPEVGPVNSRRQQKRVELDNRTSSETRLHSLLQSDWTRASSNLHCED